MKQFCVITDLVFLVVFVLWPFSDIVIARIDMRFTVRIVLFSDQMLCSMGKSDTKAELN